MPLYPDDVTAAYREAPDVLTVRGRTVRGFLDVGLRDVRDGVGAVRVTDTTFQCPAGLLADVELDEEVVVNGQRFTIVLGPELLGDGAEERLALSGPKRD